MSNSLLIKNLHASVEDTEILKGLTLEIPKAKCTPSWAPTAPESTLAKVIAGHEDYEVTEGDLMDGENLLEMESTSGPVGFFIAFQYPHEIPGVTNANFIARRSPGAICPKAKSSTPSLFTKTIYAENGPARSMDRKFTGRAVNDGFSGGEKKRNEILQMADAGAESYAVLDETDSGLDIDALKVVAEGVNRMRSPERGFLVITHYQRLLDYIVPDVVHVMSDGQYQSLRGGKDLALELGRASGYDWVLDETRSLTA